MTFNLDQSAYQAFRDIVAERTRPLLVWVGSGLSAEAGLPTWLGLETLLLETLDEKAIGLEPQDAEQVRRRAEAIRNQRNKWVAFKMLRDGLGATTYRETIRAAFSTAPKVDVPSAYRDLWKLRVRGILNLNLDRLATRAYTEYRPGTSFAEFSGRDVSRLRTLLNGHQPFVGNLHGVFEDSKSWIFTQTDLASLLKDEAYTSFIQTCLSTHAVLFLGLSADDRAVGGHLEHMASLGIETAAHYWLTDRRDPSTDKWAEAAGIRRIIYSSTTGHSDVQEFFSDLNSYVPEDPESASPPVLPTPAAIGEVDELPGTDELLQWNAEKIRKALNDRALQLLAGDDPKSFEEYEKFCAEYDQAIYRAWYTSTKSGENTLLGYTLDAEIARGSFGRVYSATSPSGGTVAVKVLLEDVRKDPDLLKSFRRGVRSMRILHEKRVKGMVAYLAAFEIPAFVVMERIDGPNLTEATEAGYLAEWPDLLSAGVQLAQIVRRAHELPERVLHRDLRPSNVMLSGYYADPQEWNVVVLDFDLSWHRGAFEQSVIHTSAAGYLAPEQMRPIKRVSTRNAAVDSFGLGMTLLFLCSGKDPSPDQHQHKDWEEQVRTACSKVGAGSDWRSVSERVARLIIAATQDSQSARWDMAEISGELERLSHAVNDPSSVSSAELLTEEVAARSEAFSDYEWDADRVRAVRTLPTGIRLEITTNLESQRLDLQIDWASSGTEDRQNLGKYIAGASKATADQLRAAGWEEVRDDADGRSVSIKANLDATHVQGRANDVAASIDKATYKLRFDG